MLKHLSRPSHNVNGTSTRQVSSPRQAVPHSAAGQRACHSKGQQGTGGGKRQHRQLLKNIYIYIYRRQDFGSFESDFRNTKPDQDQESLVPPEVQLTTILGDSLCLQKKPLDKNCKVADYLMTTLNKRNLGPVS